MVTNRQATNGKPVLTNISNIADLGYGRISSAPNTATIHLVQSSQFARRFAKFLIVGLGLAVLAMMFLPWQQTSRGTGQVVAYAPQERQQSIQSPAKGIVSRIGEGLAEGSRVEEGDFILELQPIAADMIEQIKAQLRELNTKLEAANTKAEAYEQNVTGFTEARDFAVQAATQTVASTKEKLESKKKQVSAYQAKELQAGLNFERQNRLFKQGVKSEKEIEKLRKEWDVANADLESVKRDVLSIEQELLSKQSELEEKRRLAQTKIDYARAMQQDALSSVSTIKKDILDLKIKLSETDRFVIRAPRKGTIFRMPIYEQGQTIKEGDSLLTLIPDASQKAVELYVKGNDMPLMKKGDEVRLQFEGWPAVQFAGWPSVAVGTFSGNISTIDATDNGKGEFRILVTPNEVDQPWPSDRYLSQGVRANGWVMLRNVSLGYEIWRQLNGFPVIIAEDEPAIKKPAKTPKLPK